jgi:hypothetical protein
VVAVVVKQRLHTEQATLVALVAEVEVHGTLLLIPGELVVRVIVGGLRMVPILHSVPVVAVEQVALEVMVLALRMVTEVVEPQIQSQVHL